MSKLLTAKGRREAPRHDRELVWAQARKGAIPHVQLGRYRRFREEAIEQWLRELEDEQVKA